MSFQSRDSSWQVHDPFLWRFLRSNVPLFLFLLLAAAGMMGTYWFFSPPTDGTAQAFAAMGEADSLSAPIYKEVPARPVVQRFRQSPGPLHIAIIAGHVEHDPGAVCADGLTEAQINQDVADKVATLLRERGIRTDVFAEFDPRLDNYSGTALISIHADSCDYINELATGFKLSPSWVTDSTQLYNCVESAYAAATSLPFHANTITEDMTDYHAFRKIAPGVPAIILETGFMNLDRELLTTQSDTPARGIADGVFCFLESRNSQVSVP